MKKIAVILLALLLVGCSGEKSVGLNNEVLDLGNAEIYLKEITYKENRNKNGLYAVTLYFDWSPKNEDIHLTGSTIMPVAMQGEKEVGSVDFSKDNTRREISQGDKQDLYIPALGVDPSQPVEFKFLNIKGDSKKVIFDINTGDYEIKDHEIGK